MHSILLVSFMMLEDKRNDLDTPNYACSNQINLDYHRTIANHYKYIQKWNIKGNKELAARYARSGMFLLV